MQEKGYRSPFLGRYLIRNPIANRALFCIDSLLTLIPRKRHFNIKKPKRILITNLAHIGDVVMMTSLLPVIHRALPNCAIGVVVGSWAMPLVKEHPLIDHVHTLDHWKLSKKKGYFKRFYAALKSIKKERYEVAITCCYYFPNAAFLLYCARIPVRIGYTTAGFGPLLTHPVPYTNRLQSVAEHFAALLSHVIPIDSSALFPTLAHHRDTPPFSSYIVIHMGSGNPIKEWPQERWRALCKQMRDEKLIFTGRGEKERETIARVTRGLPNCLNLADKLGLNDYVSLIAQAHLLVGVDTSAGHIAAATNTPSVLLYTGINPIEHWSPKSDQATVLIEKPPCYPCYRMRGCASMRCLKGISVEQVLAAIASKLDRKKESDHRSPDRSEASPCAVHDRARPTLPAAPQ